MTKLRVLSLFAGIGGFDLGLERTGGFETVAFCEIDPFRRCVLARHWPGVPIYHDIRELTAVGLRADGIDADCIVGGFPCQQVSSSGLRTGLAGANSGLWFEMYRLVCELRPRLLIVENVADLLSRGLGTVLGNLASSGYDAEWRCIPAAEAGLPQTRDRVWIVAYPSESGLTPGDEWLTLGARPILGHHHNRLGEAQSEAQACARYSGGADYGLPHWVDRVAALGDAITPAVPELIGNAILASLAQEGRAAA